MQKEEISIGQTVTCPGGKEAEVTEIDEDPEGALITAKRNGYACIALADAFQRKEEQDEGNAI